METVLASVENYKKLDGFMPRAIKFGLHRCADYTTE